jgi:hypothetical protein
MKLQVTATKTLDTRPPGGDGAAVGTVRHAHPVPVARRFPPVIQVLTVDDPSAEHQLAACANESYREGKALRDICTDVHRLARAIGYDATIGVQEVYSTSMPSFPGQTVISALLMLDLRPLWSNEEGARPPLRSAG